MLEGREIRVSNSGAGMIPEKYAQRGHTARIQMINARSAGRGRPATTLGSVQYIAIGLLSTRATNVPYPHKETLNEKWIKDQNHLAG